MSRMGSFLRYLVFASCLVVACYSQLKNLRPLKGILNDFDGPRNATDPRNSTDPTTPTKVTVEDSFTSIFDKEDLLPPPIHLPGEVAGFFPIAGSGGSGIGSPEIGRPRPTSPPRPISFPTQRPPRPEPSVENSIQDGITESIKQQQQQSSRPASKELELSSKFLSAFRRAEKEAEEASCVGRALIETTKQHAKRLDLPLKEAVQQLTEMEIDQVMCEKILKKEGCEDFKKPRPCTETDPYRRMDGSCNNLENPTWGKSSTPFVRFFYPAYENGVDSMRGEGRRGITRLPSPRTVSYNIQSIRANPPLSHITLMVMQWGQFIDHDITFTAETQIKKVKRRSDLPGSSTLTRLLTDPVQDELSCPSHGGEDLETVPLECCPNGNPIDDLQLTDCRPIDVSADPLFKQENRTCMRFVRSLIASQGCRLGPREQLNQITGYIDASAVYGSTDKVAHALRKGAGGHLHKTDKGNLLPRNCCEDRTFHCFKAGDTRVNEQPGLTSVHTLWLRVHEQLVLDLSVQNPHWNDNTLFQEARRVVIALIQQTTYKEWLPLVLGPEAMAEEELTLLPNGPTSTYDPEVDASIANVIATAAFRFGHTLVNDILRGSGGESVPLVGNFENAKVLFQNKTRPSAILEGLASSDSQAPDFHLVLTLTNKLFAPPEHRIGLDLMSLNIQRGRDHGLPSYTTWRTACKLPSFTSFEQLSSVMPDTVIQVFKDAYSDVGEIDLFPAALSEFPVDGGLVGPTFACLLGQQFSRLKRGDRYFFQNLMQPKPFRPDQLESISKLTLSSIICQHSDIDSLQPNAFQSAGVHGNDLQKCSSYPRLDTTLWKEEDLPTPGSPFLDILEQWASELRKNSTPACNVTEEIP